MFYLTMTFVTILDYFLHPTQKDEVLADSDVLAAPLMSF